MSSKRKGIRLTSSDVRLKKWWKYISSRPDKNGTQHIQVALNYHKQTNRYLSIGYIDISDESDIPDSTMMYYLTDDLSAWIEKRVRETGLKQTQIIKAILENSIVDADNYSCLSNAEIYNHLIQPSASISEAAEHIPTEETTIQEQHNITDIPTNIGNENIPIAPIVFDKQPEEVEEEEEELDLISAMLRENGGGLGM